MSKRSLWSIIAASAVALVIVWGAFRAPHDMAMASETIGLRNGQTFKLTAAAVSLDIHNKTQKMLAYNGSIPGPTLKVQQGSSITVNFTNKLAANTSLHFHGIRAGNQFDGVVGVTQPAVKVGQSYAYKLTFPDPGIYWYHPHLREDASQPLGLYGSIIVTPARADYWSPVNKELPVMVGDILMNNGKVAAFDTKQTNYTLMGRFGNTMLTNGSTNYHLFAQAGEVDRLYITNVASTRPLNLVIPGAKLKLVGGDNGKYERETYAASVLLSPSERAVIEVLFEKPGTFKLQNQTPQKNYDLATITVTRDHPKTSYVAQFNSLRTNADTVASIDPYRAAFSKSVDKSLALSVSLGSGMMTNGMTGMNMNMKSDNNKIEWEDSMPAMNNASTSESLTWELVDQTTSMRNNQINWQFKQGQQVKIKIYNDPNSAHPMQHPIHIHGQRFLVSSVNGKPNSNLVWKDTVLIAKGDTVELVVAMDNPGNWVIHCHIPEHMESGMLLKYSVV
jgi:suppressor of ftsI